MRLSPMFWPGVAVALVVAALDQASKWWILEVVMQPPRVIEITPYFNLVLGWNPGISFGLFGSGSALAAWLLPAAALVIVAALLVWLARTDSRLTCAAIGLIVGGAVGNLVDRARFGAVADFLDFHLEALSCPFGAWACHWPAFNLADTAITLGAATIIAESLFRRPETS